MATISQIKIIHALKNRIGLDDGLYLDMLKSFDVLTSKNLTEGEAEVFISILKEQAIKMGVWKQKAVKYSELSRTEKMASAQQLRFIESLWADISYQKDDDYKKKSLRKYLIRNFKIDDLMFLTKDKASKVINSIKKMKLNKEKSVATL